MITLKKTLKKPQKYITGGNKKNNIYNDFFG